MPEVTKSHDCKCGRGLSEIKFEEARKLPDGGVGLVHQCRKHADVECVHKIEKQAVDLILAAKPGK